MENKNYFSGTRFINTVENVDESIKNTSELFDIFEFGDDDNIETNDIGYPPELFIKLFEIENKLVAYYFPEGFCFKEYDKDHFEEFLIYIAIDDDEQGYAYIDDTFVNLLYYYCSDKDFRDKVCKLILDIYENNIDW